MRHILVSIVIAATASAEYCDISGLWAETEWPADEYQVRITDVGGSFIALPIGVGVGWINASGAAPLAAGNASDACGWIYFNVDGKTGVNRSLCIDAGCSAMTSSGVTSLWVRMPPQPAACAAVTLRAPCGQTLDDGPTCVTKGCCYDGSTGGYPCFYPANATAVTTVHVIQSCHFDAGFADSTVNILNRWFLFFPAAYALGLQLEALGGPEGLRFMAQSWVVSLYTSCPPGMGLDCPSVESLANFTAAVKAGFIYWHAFPHNGELELAHPWLIGAAINLTHGLDDAFGVPHKATLSQRDVPGTTRAAIPLLVAAGVTAISIGANTAVQPPTVPRAFTWLDPASGASLLAMWHPRGYGGIAYEDAVIVPGSSHALVFAWRNDNSGPPQSVAEVQGNFASVRAAFPGAQVWASTFDNFTAQLSAAAKASLPVLTREVGDTWVHGAASDPQKLAWSRLGYAAAAACVRAGQCDPSDPVFANFTRLFAKNCEHTWGKDVKTFLHDEANWSNAQLAAQLAANASNFLDLQASWAEQRAFGFAYPLQALGGHPLAAQLTQAWATVYPPPQQPQPAADGFSPFAPGAVWHGGRFSLAFNASTGAIAYLVDAATGQTWADGSTGLGLGLGVPFYLALDTADYTAYINDYYPGPGTPPDWYFKDVGKPGMGSANTTHLELLPALRGLWKKDLPDGSTTFLVRADFGALAAASYGAAAAYWTTVSIPASPGASIGLTLAMYNKTRTRIAEAHFVRFGAAAGQWGPARAPAASQWFVDKLGSRVDPYDIQPRGNTHLHGSTGGLAFTVADPAGKAANATMAVSSPEAGLAVFGRPAAFSYPVLQTPDPAQGAGFLLSDNTYGTNYPQWLPWRAGDENQQWHFDLAFS